MIHALKPGARSPSATEFFRSGSKKGVSMQCNKCGSENTQRLQVAFEGGTQDISATSHTAGVGSIGGKLGLSGAVTKTSGTQQSVLAQKAAPPPKAPLKPGVGLIVFGLIMMSFVGGFWFVTFGLASIAGGGYMIFKAQQFNSKEWPALYQRWLESWLCHKCGHIYHHA